jgi:hypothetical protein
LFASGEVDAIFRVLPPGKNLVSGLLQNTRGKLMPIDRGDRAFWRNKKIKQIGLIWLF